MTTNETLNTIMTTHRISNVLLSSVTSIHVTTLSRYRNNQRNIGRKNFEKIYYALTGFGVNKNNTKELKQRYEDSRAKKVL